MQYSHSSICIYGAIAFWYFKVMCTALHFYVSLNWVPGNPHGIVPWAGGKSMIDICLTAGDLVFSLTALLRPATSEAFHHCWQHLSINESVLIKMRLNELLLLKWHVLLVCKVHMFWLILGMFHHDYNPNTSLGLSLKVPDPFSCTCNG